MISAVLVRSENELREFYDWLLYRAREEEARGNKNHARVYLEYADMVKVDLDPWKAHLQPKLANK